MKKRWTTSDDYLAGLRAAAAGAGPGKSADESADATAEEKITDWLARLRNLYGVPFNLLVPDVRMLPQESIRFFRIDENWIDCLIDGAFSIGRSTTGDADREREAALFARIRVAIHNRAAVARTRRIFGASDPRAHTEAAPVRSGFLVRSGVVAGWPSIEARGYSRDGSELLPIRLDRPASDVLFGLFNGELASLSLSEPAETLHFGFQPSTNDSYSKILKWVTDSPTHPSGSLMPNASVNVPFRSGGQRVVDISGLAGAIHSELLRTGGIGRGAPYTAAELALELVQGVQKVDFPIEGAAQ